MQFLEIEAVLRLYLNQNLKVLPHSTRKLQPLDAGSCGHSKLLKTKL